MSLRILYHHRTRARDGQAVHVRELIRALRGEGHVVAEAALVRHADEGGAGAAEPPPGRSPGLWRRIQLPRVVQEILEHAYTPWGTRMLLRAAHTFRPDLVYERYAMSCGAGVRAAARLGIPCFLEVNSPMTLEMERLGLLRFPRWARAAERRILAGAHRVFTVTRVLGRMLVDLGVAAERVVVCPNGADLEPFRDARRKAQELRGRFPLEGRLVLGFIGFPRPWHRLDLLLRAMKALREAGAPELALLIIGDGPARGEVEATAKSLGLGQEVHTTGALPREEVPAAVGLLDIAVIPAINEYASPLKLFDSLAAGVPTVAPDQENLRELVTHEVDALLFRSGDGDALARELGRLVRDRALRAALGTRGRETLERASYTWAANARRVATELAAVRGER
jgi:glycosyltransferase involved in cell wall biosynthesis